MMKLYLDDIRLPPKGWILVKTATECIKLLKEGYVTHLSLDHDLGDDTNNGTGYSVLCWIEWAVYNQIEGFSLPIIEIHSQNPVGVRKMLSVIDSIKRFIIVNKNQG